MKKALILISLFLIFANGCSERNKNQFYIKNSSLGSVTLNFKGQLFTVTNGSDLLIDDISNGTYEYKTVYSVPAGVDSTAEEGSLAENIYFSGETRWSIQYVGNLKVDDAGKVTYTIGATLTSSNSSTVISE